MAATLREARALADAVCAEVGIEPVTVTVNKRLRQVLGRCYPWRREVQLAAWLLTMDGDEWAETVRHEVAHQLAADKHGPDAHGHGWQWRRACVETGATGRKMTSSKAATGWKLTVVYGCGEGCELVRTRRTKMGDGSKRCRRHGVTVRELRVEHAA